LVHFCLSSNDTIRTSPFFIYLISSWFLKSTFWREVGYIFTVILTTRAQTGGREGNGTVAISERKEEPLPPQTLSPSLLSALNSHVNLI
jgi:hypothetical protein